jgi:hypothetical protein
MPTYFNIVINQKVDSYITRHFLINVTLLKTFLTSNEHTYKKK